MENHWKMDLDAERKAFLSCIETDEWAGFPIPDLEDFLPDDWQTVYIGDEIECGSEDEPAGGIVIGCIARHGSGRPVCYKIITEDENGTPYIDYVPAEHITMHELCGDSEWSLARVGYRMVVEESGFSYFYNDETGDAIVC